MIKKSQLAMSAVFVASGVAGAATLITISGKPPTAPKPQSLVRTAFNPEAPFYEDPKRNIYLWTDLISAYRKVQPKQINLSTGSPEKQFTPEVRHQLVPSRLLGPYVFTTPKGEKVSGSSFLVAQSKGAGWGLNWVVIARGKDKSGQIKSYGAIKEIRQFKLPPSIELTPASNPMNDSSGDFTPRTGPIAHP